MRQLGVVLVNQSKQGIWLSGLTNIDPKMDTLDEFTILKIGYHDAHDQQSQGLALGTIPISYSHEG